MYPRIGEIPSLRRGVTATIAMVVSMILVLSCQVVRVSAPINDEYNEVLAGAQQANQGYKIAFGDERKIYMMNRDGTEIEVLAEGGNNAGYISWSPDAEYVYFISTMNGNWDGYRVKVDSKELTRITDFEKDVRSMGVSPDGRTLAISVMTGNSTVGNNNDDLSVFNADLYTISMANMEAILFSGKKLVLSDLEVLLSSPPSDQFWYEELNWNHDFANPVLAYTKTYRYDDDANSHTHCYTIKPDGSGQTLIAENQDQPVWSFDNAKLGFLSMAYYDFSSHKLKQVTVTGIPQEVAGANISPDGNFVIFEIGDENRKAGMAKLSDSASQGIVIGTHNVYEPRWSPKQVK